MPGLGSCVVLSWLPGIAPGHIPPSVPPSLPGIRPLAWQRVVPVPHPDKVGQALAPGSGSASRCKDALEGSGQEAGGLRGCRSWRWGWRGSASFGVCRSPFVPGCWAGCARHPPAGPRDSSRSEPPRGVPLWALPLRRGGCSTSFCPKTERARAAPALPAPRFPLAAAGPNLRSGFPPWVYPAQPGFGRNPREGFWQRRELRALARAGASVCAGSRRALGRVGDVWGALGWEGRPAGTNLWHGGLCATTCGSHRQPGWPVEPGRSHLEGWIWDREAGEGSGLAEGCRRGRDPLGPPIQLSVASTRTAVDGLLPSFWEERG